MKSSRENSGGSEPEPALSERLRCQTCSVKMTAGCHFQMTVFCVFWTPHSSTGNTINPWILHFTVISLYRPASFWHSNCQSEIQLSRHFNILMPFHYTVKRHFHVSMSIRNTIRSSFSLYSVYSWGGTAVDAMCTWDQSAASHSSPDPAFCTWVWARAWSCGVREAHVRAKDV